MGSADTYKTHTNMNKDRHKQTHGHTFGEKGVYLHVYFLCLAFAGDKLKLLDMLAISWNLKLKPKYAPHIFLIYLCEIIFKI